MKLNYEDILSEVLLSGAIEAIQAFEGIDYVTFHIAKSLSGSTDNPFVRTGYPSEWVRYYLLHNLVVSDPVLHYALRVQKPFSWSEIQLTDKERKFMEIAQSFNLGSSGYSVPCSDSLGRVSVFSVNSSLPPAEWDAYLAENAETLQALARDIHVKGVAEACADNDTIARLSPREYECLKWTSLGKSYSEIAIILSLSEHTIRSYLKMARLKLDSVTLAQAVAKATQFGLI